VRCEEVSHKQSGVCLLVECMGVVVKGESLNMSCTAFPLAYIFCNPNSERQIFIK